MATIHDDILAFLRDGQYRIAELTGEIYEDLKIGEIESPKDKHKLRLELLSFIELLYEINWGTYQGYNLVVNLDTPPIYAEGFTEDWITEEMQYLREKTGMSNLPLISFGPYYTEVVNLINPSSGSGNGGGSTGGINVLGTYRQFIMFNISNQPVAVDIDEYGGMLPNETITNYFAGRI